jgi:hypothetical protein
VGGSTSQISSKPADSGPATSGNPTMDIDKIADHFDQKNS